MSVGGATWDTAGTLDPGSGNMFTVADATTDGLLFNQAWWKFTPDAPARVTLTDPSTTRLIAYTGATETSKDAVSNVDANDGLVVFDVTAGVEYHVLIGTLSPTSPPTAYTVTYSKAALVLQHTAWQTDLRDDDRNWLIISRGDLTLTNIDTNEFDEQDWYEDVVTFVGTGRTGSYLASEVLGGEDPISAESCVKSHAGNGDEDGQLWNTSTTEIDDTGPPVCRPIFPGGVAALHLGGSTVSHSSSYVPRDLFAAAFNAAEIHSRAQAIWLKPVFDNLAERGVLEHPDPTTDSGVPAEFLSTATIEWDGSLELVGVEVGVDDVPPDPGFPDPGDLAAKQLLAVDVNPTVGPTGGSGVEWGPWSKGSPPGPPPDPPQLMADGLTSKPHLTYYEPGDGTPGWTAYEGLDDWGKAFDPESDDPPDILCTLWTTGGHDGWPEDNVSLENPYHVAVKLTLRAPRYRWVWIDVATTTVVRQWPRQDVRGLSSAPRLYPLNKSQRLFGGYPGGSNG